MARQTRSTSLRGAPPQKKNLRWGIIIVIVALLAYLVVAYVLVPHEVSWFWQRLLGLGCAGLALATFLAATHREESPEELLLRLRRTQHSDFGKQLLLARPKRKTIRLPKIGEVSVRGLVGAGVFAAVWGWWLTPWAPVVVRRFSLEELTTPLREQVLAAVLVQPTPAFVLPQPPLLSSQVRAPARQIREGDGPYKLGLKAIAEARHADARRILEPVWEESGEAEVACALGQNEMYAGQFNKAATWFEKALEKSPTDILLLAQAAIAWLQAANTSKATTHAEKALKLVQKLPARHPDQAPLWYLQALLLVAQGKDYHKAQDLWRRSQELLEAAEKQHGVFVPASQNNQAVLYLLLGNYAAADILLHRAEERWRAVQGAKHPLLTAARHNLALRDYRLGSYASARKLLQDAVSLRSREPSRELFGHALELTSLAEVHLALAEYEDARSNAEHALKLVSASVGMAHPGAAAVHDVLGRLYTALGLYAKAEGQFTDALDVLRRTVGEQHPFTATLICHQAALRVLRGRCAEADEMCQQAAAVFSQSFGEKHLSIAEPLRVRGDAARELNRPGEARTHYRRALALQKETYGEEHPELATTWGRLAALDDDPETYARGQELYGKAIETSTKFLGPSHPQVARLHFGLAKLHLDRGQIAAAVECLKTALAVQEQRLPDYHPHRTETMMAYAAVLEKLAPRNAPEAEKLRTQAAESRRKLAEQDQLD